MYEESRVTGTATAPQREPQVSSSFIQLEEALKSAEEVMSVLEKRLDNSGVIRNEPEEAGKPSQAEPSVVGMAERITRASRDVSRLSGRIQSILRRLEI
jgi:hypothetical protein